MSGIRGDRAVSIWTVYALGTSRVLCTVTADSYDIAVDRYRATDPDGPHFYLVLSEFAVGDSVKPMGPLTGRQDPGVIAVVGSVGGFGTFAERWYQLEDGRTYTHAQLELNQSRDSDTTIRTYDDA